ncbi:uncharacterized, partial [Tachysurus ichikawai]
VLGAHQGFLEREVYLGLLDLPDLLDLRPLALKTNVGSVENEQISHTFIISCNRRCEERQGCNTDPDGLLFII